MPIVWTAVLSLKAGGLVLDVTMGNRMQNHSKLTDEKQASKKTKRKKKKPSHAGVKTCELWGGVTLLMKSTYRGILADY